jgi:hypothetical protein
MIEKPEKEGKDMMASSADSKFGMIRVIEKGYGGCRRVGGDSGKVGNMMAA